VASVQDFEVACEIILPILSQTYKDLSPKEEALAQIIKEECGLGHFADSDNAGDKDVNVFSPKELLEKLETRCTKKEDKMARNFRSDSTLKRYVTKLTKKGLLEWNEGKGIKSKYALIGDTPPISFQISLSQWTNTPKSESSLGETLAQGEVSQSRANEPMSDGFAQDKPIGSP